MPISVRRRFPIFTRRIHGNPLAYLDSAATTQKPLAVLSAMDDFYRRHCANPRRGLHQLGVEATAMVEDVRQEVAAFIGGRPEEVIFTSGTTAGINLVAYGWAPLALRAGDTVLVSLLEHHSNFVPWQQLATLHRWRVQFIPVGAGGKLDTRWLRTHLHRRVKLVCITHTSNALGTQPPLPAVVSAAHRVGARVLVDAAQAVAHQSIDVQRLDCDFLAFSGHKMYGPMGVGVLWGRAELLRQSRPFHYGGEMIRQVRQRGTTFADSPAKFEAGTQNAGGIVGLGAAIRWIKQLGFRAIARHERQLMVYALRRLSALPGVVRYGPAGVVGRGPVISFNLRGVHAHDVAQILDARGIAVRAGHHCAMPLMEQLKVPSTVRVSFGAYNIKEDVDRLIKGLKEVQRIFSGK
ncbi:MAG: cysteine desulfurase / selenocysteine lyase [Parcubacteria group bacterium Gr01-1014_31]|nr:MAG: cysteine desulfurase / selenocysteine lyase [Parcubacteria group bacterium Gr01-1014_31]